MSATNGKISAEARAIITAIFLIGYFVTVNVIPIYAPSFFEQIFTNLTILFASAIMNFYGARNGEKRTDQIIQQLPSMVASQTIRELAPMLKELLGTAKQSSKPL